MAGTEYSCGLDFQVRVDPVSDDAVVVRVCGELDRWTGRELEQVFIDILRAGNRRVDVDLGTVWFVDCGGLAVVERAARHALDRGAHLAVVDVSPPAVRLIDMLGAWWLLV